MTFFWIKIFMEKLSGWWRHFFNGLCLLMIKTFYYLRSVFLMRLQLVLIILGLNLELMNGVCTYTSHLFFTLSVERNKREHLRFRSFELIED